MKKVIYGLLAAILFSVTFTSCERVEPNYEGVLMSNWGKNGKPDFSLQRGLVNTMGPGTKLYQVPLWEQRASFEDNEDDAKKILHLKSSDNTEVTCHPQYTFKVIDSLAVDVVFENKQLGDGKDFMKSLEDNILEMKIYDVMREESRKWTNDSMMATGGSLRFEEDVETLVRREFRKKGLELITFSCQLDYSDAVKKRIDKRNETQQDIAVTEQQIILQQKKNELALLKAKENENLSTGLTPAILTKEFIDKWDGKSSVYGNSMLNLFRNVQ